MSVLTLALLLGPWDVPIGILVLLTALDRWLTGACSQVWNWLQDVRNSISLFTSVQWRASGHVFPDQKTSLKDFSSVHEVWYV
jgi:hypothetical protein